MNFVGDQLNLLISKTKVRVRIKSCNIEVELERLEGPGSKFRTIP